MTSHALPLSLEPSLWAKGSIKMISLHSNTSCLLLHVIDLLMTLLEDVGVVVIVVEAISYNFSSSCQQNVKTEYLASRTNREP